jgi:AGCS family alanine or glycine:cation symporter
MVQGAIGSSFLLMVQLGVSKSVFSNEAGLGISAIAAAAAKTDSPGRQAMITMTGALLSTVVVCTITAVVLATTGVLGTKDAAGHLIMGAPLAIKAFHSVLPFGNYVVMVGLILFAYSTLLAWGYYGEKCVEYVLGEKSIFPFRILYCLLVIPGCLFHMQIVWDIADIMNGLMAIPNLIALILFRNVIWSETRLFLEIADRERRSV